MASEQRHPSQGNGSGMTSSGSGSGLSAKAPTFQPTATFLSRRSSTEQAFIAPVVVEKLLGLPQHNGQAHTHLAAHSPVLNPGLNVYAPAFQLGARQSSMLGGVSPVMPPVSPLMSGGGNVSPFPAPSTLSPSSPYAFANSPVSPGALSEASAGTPHTTGWGLAAHGPPQWQNRRPRGPPAANQPLKTFGHNSRPSVSQNPAALAAVLAATQKVKRKILVRLPNERSCTAAALQHAIAEEEDDDGEGEGRPTRESSIRKRWLWRSPLLDANDVFDSVKAVQIESISSSDEEKLDSLPDFVDIYLPGDSAWEEIREAVDRERQESMVAEQADQLQEGWGLGAGNGDGATFGLTHDQKSHTSEQPITQTEGEMLSAPSHNSAMSLSVPSAGLPFGPSALSALGLPSPTKGQKDGRALSDPDRPNAEPALGVRPQLERLDSDPAPSAVTPSQSSQPKKAPDSSWKVLGQGFGYDVAEPQGDAEFTREEEGSQAAGILSSDGEDADSSELDEELGVDSAEWLKRRRLMSNKPVEAEMEEPDSDDDSSNLDDFLSEEFSNPSDEEAARRERQLRSNDRTNMHAQMGSGQNEPTKVIGSRPRADTADTFASSGLGDEVWNDGARTTSIRSIDIMPRGPLDAAPQAAGAMSRSSTKSAFRADAPVFNPAGEGDAHFRLPSITRSSFGQSFRHGSRTGSGVGLNAAAPSFVPGAFTFTAPSNAPKLPTLKPSIEQENQGREKRTRHFTAEQRAADRFDMDNDFSPPRPGPSAASLEGGLRYTADGRSHDVLHPFTATQVSYLRAEQQPILGSFSFQSPDPTFTPGSAQHDEHAIPESDFTFSLPRQTNVVVIRRPDGVAEQRVAAKAAPSHPRHNLSMLTDGSFDPARTFGAAARRGDAGQSQGHAEHITRAGKADEDEDDDDGTVSDIIEELGDRMDRALEGWAGKILDEVTIMGQVRPLNVVSLEAGERKMLVDSIGREVGDLLADYQDRLHERLLTLPMAHPRHFIQTSESDTSTVRPDSVSAMGERSLVWRGSTSSLRSHARLDEEVGEREEGDADERQQLWKASADAKREEMLSEVRAAIVEAIPQAIEGAVNHVKSILQAERLEAGLVMANDQTERVDQADTAAGASSAASSPHLGRISQELSAESSDLLATLLIGRMQPVLDELSGRMSTSNQHGMAITIEPMLEDFFTQSKTRSQAERHDLLQGITDAVEVRQKALQQAMTEAYSAASDSMQASLVERLLPHLSGLKVNEDMHADIICGRITEILVPLIKGDEGHHGGNAGDSSIDVAEMSTLVVQQLRPILQQQADRDASLGNRSLFDATEVDHDVLADRLVERLRADKGLVNGNVGGGEIDAIIAFLEPLVQRQDEVRTLSRRALEKQEEVETILTGLPSAVNAKMDVLLATHQTLQDEHSSMMKRLEELVQEKAVSAQDAESKTISQEAEEEMRQLTQKIDEERRQKDAITAEAAQLKKLLQRAAEDKAGLEDANGRLKERYDELGKRADEMHAERARSEARIDGLEALNATLADQVERLEREVRNSREERAHERQSAAQSASDVLVRCERAEEQLRTERSRVEVLLEQMRSSEQDVHATLQRAAKAEGEAAGLEKRVAEQDAKIGNLQQLTATQKQKAAQSGQKLSEVEKRLRQLESSDRELHVAQARLKDMESRAGQVEEMQARIRARADVESDLREEVAAYQAQFLGMERDLMNMRDTLVGRDELEHSQADLTSAREEIAELRGQIAERDRRDQELEQRHAHALEAAVAAVTSPAAVAKMVIKPSNSVNSSHGSTTWASIYAPDDDDDHFPSRRTFAEDSFASPRPNQSILSTGSRNVECSVDGWWS